MSPFLTTEMNALPSSLEEFYGLSPFTTLHVPGIQIQGHGEPFVFFIAGQLRTIEITSNLAKSLAASES